jgi:hypothetical protein
MRKSLLQALLPPLIAALFLGVLIVLGKAARDALRGSERTSIAFADIDCPPPPGQERADFLGEVQYLGGLPDRVNVLDDGLAERLAEAFAKHPWVEKVERVEVKPPKQVRVQVVYRTPVLAVKIAGNAKPPGGLRLIEARSGMGSNMLVFGRTVDGNGLLLPVRATVPGIALLLNDVTPPTGTAGTPWGDPTVEAAARTAGVLQTHQAKLELVYLEAKEGEFVLYTPAPTDNRVLWGHAPGSESPEEAPAEEKVKRLLDYIEQHGDLGADKEPIEHDVRPRDQAIHRPLAQDH